MVRIHDLATGETIDRQMNDEEFLQYQQELADELAAQQQVEAAAAKKAAILAALADATGYTADELREALNA